MKLRNLEFFLRETFINIRRNGLMTVAAVSTVVVALTILGVFMMSVATLSAWTQEAAERVEITAFLVEDVKAEQRERVRQEIESLTTVSSVRFVSADEALARLKERFSGQIDFSDIGNPLTDSFEVQVRDKDHIAATASEIETIDSVEDVVYGKEIAGKLMRIKRVIGIIGVVTGLLMCLATITIIHNAIRLTVYARRREIRVMQLVGATNGFIRAPFVFEGVFHGMAGAVVSIALLLAGYAAFTAYMAAELPFVSFIPFTAVRNHVALGMLILGVLFGVSGSALSIRRFLAAL